MTAQQVVQAGIDLLDRDKPGWRERVNPDELDIWTNCIIHQVYGDDQFVQTLERLGIRGKAGKHGFNIDCELNISPKDLAEEWKRRLTK